MSYFLLQGIQRNIERKHNPADLYSDIQYIYGKANKYFFSRGKKFV